LSFMSSIQDCPSHPVRLAPKTVPKAQKYIEDQPVGESLSSPQKTKLIITGLIGVDRHPQHPRLTGTQARIPANSLSASELDVPLVSLEITASTARMAVAASGLMSALRPGHSPRLF